MVINWIAFSLKVLCSLNASFITNLSKVCPKLTFISSLGFFIAFLTLVSNYCTPTVSFLLHSQHLQISNSTSVFSRKQQKYLSGQTISTLNTKQHCAMPNLSKEAIHREHPSHREHLNTHALESYATNKQGLHTFILTLPKFGTPASTNSTIFWMAAWDKPNTYKRSGKNVERDQHT